MTGIDRVELAYLLELLTRPDPVFGLVRTGLGFVLADRRGMQAIADRALGLVPLGPATLLSRLSRRGDPLRARAEADVRRVALARAPAAGLAAMLRRHVPGGVSYINVGHANLSRRVFDAVHALSGGRVAVLVHDVIPLDHPEFARPGIPQVFARKMAVVGAGADLVIHITHAARRRTEAQLGRLGRIPPGMVAGLGVAVAPPDRATVPGGLDLVAPYFVAIGTIEPRKNIGLLLDLWAEWQSGPGPVPRLFLLGSRGWANEAVFLRLDALRAAGGPVVELPGLGDAALASVLAGARALLFPSLAEGFGLPPVEAAALGVPVVCSDLDEVREVMGDYPVYLSPSDRYSWLETLKRLGQAKNPSDRTIGVRIDPPRWQDHFKAVLSRV